MNLKQAVAFAILMEQNGGILNKAPIYVLEKLEVLENHNCPEALLDSDNRSIFEAYFEKWEKK
ncbi:MAG: hypothetical protein J7L26_12675 [Candidatus Aminicenantes bacterium]|nr:hypothetical protein [Candidatus Aminicenantes bacterium]